MNYPTLSKLLFKFDPETVHDLTINSLSKTSWMSKVIPTFQYRTDLSTSIGSLKWSNPIGLAAGLDKNAKAIHWFHQFGFGAIEVGTITEFPQQGNPKPRVFRIPSQFGIRNAMGFPNDGLDQIKKRLQKNQSSSVIGANIGKNKDTSGDATIAQYQKLAQSLNDYCDYLVINISSPNTKGLRDLQTKEFALELLQACKAVSSKPIGIKIAPDMNEEQIKDLTLLSCEHADFIIATNTTIIENLGVGGVSGRPLFDKSNHVRKLVLKYADQLPVIGVGGFENLAQIEEFFKYGGSAIQIYSALIYYGPLHAHHLLKQLDEKIFSFGIKSLDEYKLYLRKNA